MRPQPPDPVTAAPVVSVVIASHDRPRRLAALLDALAAQEAPGGFEVVVVHDSGDDTERVLTEHPLGARGVLRHERLAPGTGRPSVQRNRGWRAARADRIAFTDDDCRPAPGWLAALVGAWDGPGGAAAIIQGSVEPDPLEAHLLRRPLSRSLTVVPPSPFGQTANIAYPRALLEAVGGFDERLPAPAGEDTDLLLRAREHGAVLRPAPEALVWHAVAARSFGEALRDTVRWQHVAHVVRRHPTIRRGLVLRIFWKPSHLALTLALAATVLRRRGLVALALAGWARGARPSYGPSLPGRVRAVADLPMHLVLDLFEVGVIVRGAVRYRTVFL